MNDALKDLLQTAKEAIDEVAEEPTGEAEENIQALEELAEQIQNHIAGLLADD